MVMGSTDPHWDGRGGGGGPPPPGAGWGGGGEQSISAHVIKPIFVIALHTYIPLSLTFTEEKGETPS